MELGKVNLPYVITDTNSFLRKIIEINNSGVLADKDVIHVSFDVVSMFPSISECVGLEQCTQHLNKRSQPILFSTDCIIDALKITLNHNLTEFENVMYRQIKGTAMGPKNACAYADVAMNAIDMMVNEGDWDPEYRPIFWGRYRDDIYIPWTHGLEKLESFHVWLNSRLPGIKFTKEYDPHGIVFLDTYVYCSDNNILQTKPYSKPCDEHTFLVPSSCHPMHNLRNIPYSTGHRLTRIASEPHEYELSKNEYIEHLTARGYSIGIIHEAFEKLESKGRLNLLNPERNLNTTIDRVFPFVCDFNPGLPNVAAILNKHKHILLLDDELKDIIKPENIFASFRGTKTIEDLLVHSKLPILDIDPENQEGTIEPDGICQPCSKGCVLCKNYLVKTAWAYSFHTSSRFKIKGTLDCDSKNIVYIINDKVCNLSSIGCTADTLKVRFSNHKSHIKSSKRTCEVSKHFSDNTSLHVLDRSSTKNYDLSLKDQIEVIIIEQVNVTGIGQDTQSRLRKCKEREWFWQNNLKTLQQYGGMNVREERSST